MGEGGMTVHESRTRIRESTVRIGAPPLIAMTKGSFDKVDAHSL
jgi:hypothetical protein